MLLYDGAETYHTYIFFKFHMVLCINCKSIYIFFTILSVLSIITRRREKNVLIVKTFTCKLRGLYLVTDSFIYL